MLPHILRQPQDETRGSIDREQSEYSASTMDDFLNNPRCLCLIRRTSIDLIMAGAVRSDGTREANITDGGYTRTNSSLGTLASDKYRKICQVEPTTGFLGASASRGTQ